MKQDMDSMDDDRDQNILARAIYDNEADSPDELQFRKGELLTVVQKTIPGLPGWWMCSIRGVTGKCPANRLQIVTLKDVMRMSKKNLTSSHSAFDFKQIANMDSKVSLNNKRQSWHCDHMPDSNQMYDVPREAFKSCDSLQYDLPKSVTSGLSTLRLHSSGPLEEYDIPKNQVSADISNNVTERHKDILDYYDHPQSYFSNSSTASYPDSSYDDYDVPSNNNPVTKASLEDYDIPSNRDGFDSCFNSAPEYDVPIHSFVPQAQSITFIPPSPSALVDRKSKPKSETLKQLKTDLLFVLRRLLSQIQPRWRERSALEPKIMEYRMNVVLLDSKLKELIEYEEHLCKEMSEDDQEAWTVIMESIKESSKLIGNCISQVEATQWFLPALCRDSYSHVPDDLDGVIAQAQNLSEILRSTFEFIEMKYPMLWDHDGSGVVKTAEEGDQAAKTSTIRGREQQLIKAFIARMEIETIAITSSVQNFFNLIRSNQPPKVFSEATKSLLLNCFQVVYIGDAMCSRLTSQELYGQVQKQCGGICTALNTMVQATKAAAHSFPNILAVQNMIYSVVDVNFLIRNFKALVMSAAAE